MDKLAEARLYIVAHTGPLSFTIQENESSTEAEAAPLQFKVALGSPHKCTCGAGACTSYCVHIAFILVKNFLIPRDNPLAFQTSLTDAEIEGLLRGKHLQGSITSTRRQKAANSGQASVGRTRNPVSCSDVCPICLESILDEQQTDTSCIAFCMTCGNSVHERCISIYLHHARRNGSTGLCPYCRAVYVDGRTSENRKGAEHTSADSDARLPVAKRQQQVSTCKRCGIPLGARYVRQTYSTDAYCMECLLSLDPGSFEINRRRIILARTLDSLRREREAATQSHYRHFLYLQYRDIEGADIPALMALGNPLAHSVRKTCLRFPAYLVFGTLTAVPKEVASQTQEPLTCLLCGAAKPRLDKLIIDAKEAGTCYVSLNETALCEAAYRHASVRLSPHTVARYLAEGHMLQLPCKHVVHKICGIVCSLGRYSGILVDCSQSGAECGYEGAPQTANDGFTDKPRKLAECISLLSLQTYTKSDSKLGTSQHEGLSLATHGCRIKPLDDYCASCGVVFLPEWLRESRLDKPKRDNRERTSSTQVSDNVVCTDQYFSNICLNRGQTTKSIQPTCSASLSRCEASRATADFSDLLITKSVSK